MSVPSKTDLMYEISYNPKFVLHRSPKVNIKTITIDSETRYFMKNHETGSLYDLTEFGNDLWNLIDGKRTIKEINETLKGMYKDLRPDLAKESLLYYAEEGVLEAALEPVEKKRVSIVSAFMVRVSLFWNSTKFIQLIERVFRPFLRRKLLWPILVFVTIMGLLFAGNFISIFTHKENFEIMGSTVVGFFFYYFIILAPVIAIHEISHGLALVHYGGAPREMGTGLYFFGPMFYIDVTDGWALNRYQRIMIYAAGPISEILIGSVLLLIQYLWQFPASTNHIVTMAVFYCFWGLLIDLSPLLETDGYNILCDVVKIPNLREKSFNHVKTIVTKPFKKAAKDEDEALTGKTRAILLIYVGLAAVWAVYLVVRSLMVVTYMAQDTAVSVLNVSSAFLLNQSVTATTVMLSVASVLYFGMVMSGYVLLIFMGLKRAVKRTLRFEAVHDRDFSVFLYLPMNVPQWLFTSLKQEVTRVAKSLTQNFSVSQKGSMCIAVLRMSSARLALDQLRKHFGNIEKRFSAVYQSFLKRHRNEILESVGVCGSQKTSLSFLLSEIAEQAVRTGSPEARTTVSQVVERQRERALYLLSSVYGGVWTVELPPNLLHEVGETLLPSLLAEDLLITDLYNETEEFKKRTVYSFDSLAKLAIENRTGLQEVLGHPEKYQVVSFFEPVKSRLIFVGRTEQIENLLDSIGCLFVCQVWSGYLDNALSEINLSLFAFSNFPMPTDKSIRVMRDGELAALEKDLSILNANERLVKESLSSLKKHLRYANTDLEELESRLRTSSDFKIGLLDAALKINAENLAHLPSQFESFDVLYREHYAQTKKIEKTVKKELDERKPLALKRKRRRLAFSPFLVALSAILGFLGIDVLTGYLAILFLAAALLLQLFYWTGYFMFTKSFDNVDRYPSSAFRQAHIFTFAFTESLYEFMIAANILTPMEPASTRTERKQTTS